MSAQVPPSVTMKHSLSKAGPRRKWTMLIHSPPLDDEAGILASLSSSLKQSGKSTTLSLDDQDFLSFFGGEILSHCEARKEDPSPGVAEEASRWTEAYSSLTSGDEDQAKADLASLFLSAALP